MSGDDNTDRGRLNGAAPIHEGEPATGALALLSALFGALACLPIFGGYWWYSHEMRAYPVRVKAYLSVLAAGSAYPRWVPELYSGHGSPFFNYYAPGVYAAAALFCRLGLDVAFALKLVMVLGSAAGAVGLFGLVLGETRRSDAALLAAVFFVFMPYHMGDLFVRGDLAEYLALSWLALAIWAYRALERRPRLPVYVGAALAHAALLFTHTLMALWGTELIAVVLLPHALRLARAKDWRRLGALAATLAAAVGLSAVYTLPALFERSQVHIDQLIDPQRHLDLFENFGSAASFYTPGIGYLGPIPAIFFLVAAVRAFRRDAAIRRTFPWWLGVLALLFLMLPVSRPVWHLFPFARYLQFPWRVLGLVSVLLPVAIGLTWATAIPASHRHRLTLSSALALLCALLALRLIHIDNWFRADAFAESTAGIADGMTAADEYLPALVQPSRPRAEPVVHASAPGIRVHSAMRAGVGFRVRFDADRAGTIDLGHFWFPGWTARSRSVSVQPSNEGLIRLSVPRAGSYDVAIRFGSTPIRTFATVISIFTLLFPLAFFAALRARKAR
jgi:hypothetical protein